MNLPPPLAERVVQTALSFLGHKYTLAFECVAFVRTVFKEVRVCLPKLGPNIPPPKEWNLKAEELHNPPPGRVLFLLDPHDPRKERAWTHVVVTLPDNKCVHNSLFFGEKVIITPLEEILKRYNFAPST